MSTQRSHFADPQTVYQRAEVPYKNASTVQLNMDRFNPDVHYRTEQRSSYEVRFHHH